jgi:fucose 4-O-acetylase-like acetyltransferase
MKVEKKINIGLAILRIYLSFVVVTVHSFKPKATIRQKFIIKIIYNSIHVPNFYLLSFYFCYNLFNSKNIRKIKIRFQRLLIPYFIWPIIFWSLENLLSFIFQKNNKIAFKELMLQLLTGHVFMTVLWFQYDLIFITLSLCIIHLLFNENLIIYILINLQIFGIFFTHSNYNFIYFNKFNFNKKYTFGRLFEIVPYCIMGYIIAYLNLVNIISKHRIISIYILYQLVFFFYFL